MTATEHTDQELTEIVEHMRRSVIVARQAVHAALLEVTRMAERDAAALAEHRVDTIGAWEPKYPVKHRKVERVRLGLRAALADHAAWQREHDRRMATRDTLSSASCQHYIDTGNFLSVGEALNV